MANDSISTVLAVSSDANDSEVVQNILGEWKVKSARNCAEALFMLRNAGCSVVICDKDLPDGSWRDLLSGMGRLLSAPPLVVMSRHADESLWAEVRYYHSYGFYFSYLQSPIITAEADADGKFTMQIPRTGEYLIGAQTDRLVWNETEVYYWLQPVSLEG